MRAHPELISAFSAGLTSGRLPAGLTAGVPDEATRRFAVYRNNVVVGLADALSKRFPVIERLVGHDFFHALGRIYLEAHRPTTPVLIEWGDTFPDFLTAFPPLADYPYMADVARIELARGRAYHAADAPPIPSARLAALASDPGSAQLGLHPSVQILRLLYPAVSIWAANQPGAMTQVAGMAGAQIALVLRDAQYRVQVMAICAGDAALISALQAGQTLLMAAELGSFATAGHDPQPILLTLMQAKAITLPKDQT